MRLMHHINTVAEAARISGPIVLADCQRGLIARPGHDYARRADGTIARSALAIPADRALHHRLARLDAALESRDLTAYRIAAQRVGYAAALAGHAVLDRQANLEAWGTTDVIEIARMAIGGGS